MSQTGRRNPVTIRDVATRALVSIGTASRVLNNHPNVEPDLRVRVLSAASELGYNLPHRKNGYHPEAPAVNGHSNTTVAQSEAASGPAAPITHVAFCCRPTISHLVPEASNPYYSLLLRGVETECRRQGLHLIYRIINDEADEIEHGKRMLQESGAEALLLINFINEELIRGLLELNLPAVLVDHYFPDLPIDVVSHENYNGAVRAVRHIIDKGHTRIGFLDGLPHYTIQRRFEGYRRALEEAGLPFERARIVRCDLTLDGGIAAAHEVVQRGLDNTAYFCSNDWSAIGFIQGLRAHGLRVPEDISVVGYDDTEGARIITPPLTTVRANAESLGRVAVRKLLERVQDPALPVTQTLLYTSLIERQSVRSFG